MFFTKIKTYNNIKNNILISQIKFHPLKSPHKNVSRVIYSIANLTKYYKNTLFYILYSHGST